MAMQNTLFILWPRVRYPALLRYGASLVIATVAFLVRLALEDWTQQAPLLLFIPAVFLAALLFGARAGMFTAVISAILATGYTLEWNQGRGPVASSLVALGLFVAISALISFTTGKLHEAMRQLAASEAEKSLLLEELAHRTRNDLLMVISTLSLQARSMTDPAARGALEAAVNRINVIAQAQERLGTRAGHRGFVKLKTYLQGLCNGLGELLRDVRPIALRVTAPEFEMSSHQAVSVGLIVNELVTNALKHAFPDGLGSVISVQVERWGDGLRLLVEDDGVGCPASAGDSAGLGSRLVRMLTAQYDGDFQREPRQRGCRACVTLRSIQTKENGRT